jgi:hypothetical protein
MGSTILKFREVCDILKLLCFRCESFFPEGFSFCCYDNLLLPSLTFSLFSFLNSHSLYLNFGIGGCLRYDTIWIDRTACDLLSQAIIDILRYGHSLYSYLNLLFSLDGSTWTMTRSRFSISSTKQVSTIFAILCPSITVSWPSTTI